MCKHSQFTYTHALLFMAGVALAQQLRYGRATPTSFVDDVEINDNDDGVS